MGYFTFRDSPDANVLGLGKKTVVCYFFTPLSDSDLVRFVIYTNVFEKQMFVDVTPDQADDFDVFLCSKLYDVSSYVDDFIRENIPEIQYSVKPYAEHFVFIDGQKMVLASGVRAWVVESGDTDGSLTFSVVYNGCNPILFTSESPEEYEDVVKYVSVWVR